MNRTTRNLLIALVLGLVVGGARAQEEPIENSVTYARSWDEAVAEARMMNAPIVIHSHGFYCGPCWGMHSSVLCNKKYVKYADANTVEVISLSRLEEGKEKNDRRAATYETKDGKRYMVEFPNLTYEEMIALNRSKAASYNDTGKVPFTAIVDPHSLKELRRWSGGTSAKSIIEACEEARKNLVREHGAGFDRAKIRAVTAAVERAEKLTSSGDYSAAVGALDKVAKGQQAPEAIRERIDSARERIVQAAAARLDEIAALSAPDSKRELERIVRKLRGTGLEDRAREMLEALKES